MPTTRKRGRSDEVVAKQAEVHTVASKKQAPAQKKAYNGKKKAAGTSTRDAKPPPAPRPASSAASRTGKREAFEGVIHGCGRVLTEAMETPVFRPSEEEFADFYEYACKLDKLVGHIGVCKVIPPEGWKARRHDDGVYTLQGSLSRLEKEVEVKGPIQQNAVGGKGVYMNMHQVKRKMSLDAFKKHAMKPENMPPALEKNFDDDAIREQERKFWRNVLFNPPVYGADCPVPKGFRGDGQGGLFDPEICGDWDLAKLPSLLTTGLKKVVPGVNTPFLYIGMYRAAFAWHCEDMDLHSINYLHFGAPKTWYTVPATHARELEALARQHFPEQASICKEFLRHKTNMMEPCILLRAGIPLTRTVQRPGEFIINFPGAYHSGFNNGYNCAESCNFATEYWVPFGVQARPCGCPMSQNSVRIDVDAMLRKVKDVRVKGEQWLECELCHKWRLQPPYMMHLMKEGDTFICSAIKGLTCGTKEEKWESDQWEVDGKVLIGIDSTKENWVMCEQCQKWRKVPLGTCIDLDESFVCTMLDGWNCCRQEERWEAAEGEGKWQMVDTTGGPQKVLYGEWSEGEETRSRVKFLMDELSRFGVEEFRVASCKKDTDALKKLLSEVKSDWNGRWTSVRGNWEAICAPCRVDGHIVAKTETLGKAAHVAQVLWMMSVDEDERKEDDKRQREIERRKKKLEAEMLEEAIQTGSLLDAMRLQSIPVGPADDHPDWRYKVCRFTVVLIGKGTADVVLSGREAIGDRNWTMVHRLVKDSYHQHSYSILIPLKPPPIEIPSAESVQIKTEGMQGTVTNEIFATVPPPVYLPSVPQGAFPLTAATSMNAIAPMAVLPTTPQMTTGPTGMPWYSTYAQGSAAAYPGMTGMTVSGLVSMPTYIPPRPPPTHYLSLRFVASGSKEEAALFSHLEYVQRTEGAGAEGSCYSVLGRGIEVACGYKRWADEYRARDAGRTAERKAESHLAALLSRSVRKCLGVADGGVYDEACTDGMLISDMEGSKGPCFVEQIIVKGVWDGAERAIAVQEGSDASRRIVVCDTAPPLPPRPTIVPCIPTSTLPGTTSEVTPNPEPASHEANTQDEAAIPGSTAAASAVTPVCSLSQCYAAHDGANGGIP